MNFDVHRDNQLYDYLESIEEDEYDDDDNQSLDRHEDY